MSKSRIVSIVVNDASVRAAMQSLVRSLISSCSCSKSAEDFLRSPQFDDSSCLITDIQMPGMSGLDLQDCLIAQGTHIPTIFITAFPEQSIRSRRKPVARSAFRKAIRREDYDQLVRRLWRCNHAEVGASLHEERSRKSSTS